MKRRDFKAEDWATKKYLDLPSFLPLNRIILLFQSTREGLRKEGRLLVVYNVNPSWEVFPCPMKLWSKDRSLHLRAFPLPFLTPSPQQRLYVQNELHWSHTYPKIVPSLEHSIVRRFGKGTVLVIIRSNTNWTTENEVKTLGHVTFSNNHSPPTKTVKKKSNQSKRWNTICCVELHYGNVLRTLNFSLITKFRAMLGRDSYPETVPSSNSIQHGPSLRRELEMAEFFRTYIDSPRSIY